MTTFLCTSQQRHRYVSNKTPKDVLVERQQGVSVVRLHNVLMERHDDGFGGRNNNIPSVRLHNVSNKSQIKHSTTSQWYVSKTSQWYVFTTSHYYVSTISCASPNWSTQQCCGGTSTPRLGVALLWWSLRFQVTLSWAQSICINFLFTAHLDHP